MHAPHRLGDARYRAQQLPAAKALYREALQWRQLCCGPLTAGQAGPEQQLELAASLIKVADISMVRQHVCVIVSDATAPVLPLSNC
jgi:hypothetical protein